MEQSDSSVLTVHEIQTDDAQVAQITEQDIKVTAECDQDFPKVCKLPSESILTVDNTDIRTIVKSEDYIETSNSEVSKEVAKEIDDTSNQVESESTEPNTEIYKSEQEEIQIYNLKDKINSNHESQHLSNEEDQSLNVITESKIIKEDEGATEATEAKETTETKEATNSLENDCNIIEDANQSDSRDKQDVLPDESRLNKHGGQSHDVCESVEETIKEMHDNDNNQNNSATNAELTKLVQEETEVVVVVETVPVATDATADIIVTLEEKDANKKCNQENVTLQEKQIVESDHGNDEIDLIHYSQENDDTIIEVTEVIAPLDEQFKQSNMDYIESNKCDTKSIKLIDGKIAIDESVNDENIKVKTTDNKTSINSGKEDKEDVTIIIDEKIIITEVESAVESTTDLSQIENTHKNTVKEIIEHKQDDTSVNKVSAVDSSTKKRNFIQDIFDDWGVENTDEDTQSSSKVQDSVEIELKSLMDEAKTDQTVSSESVVTFQEKVSSADKEYDETHNIVSTIEKSTTKEPIEETENQKKNKAINKDAMSLNKDETNSPMPPVNKSSRSMDTHPVNASPHDTTVPKSRARHLTSQIASPAEVTEVLKERFREKQKSVETSRGPDIFFVKKLTQRLSSKLGGSTVNPIPKLIPLPQQTASSNPLPSSVAVSSASENCDKKEAENTTTEAGKDSNSDNKELLAILEGDIDPDWSILKPPVLTEESKTASNTMEHSEQSNPPKLDPLVERELALKQLLELPISPSKKIPPRKKKTFRAASGKASKDATTVAKGSLAAQRKEANIDLASENTQPNAKSVGIDLNLLSHEKNQEQISIRIEESRSGRKRKPTEKAREHEQNTIKRQKVYRGKVSINKKQMEEKSASSDSSTIENHVTTSDTTNVAVNNEKIVTKEVAGKQSENKIDSVSNKIEDSSSKRSKPGLAKKGSIAKKKMVVKKLLRQKVPTDKKSVQLKTKLTPSPKKTPPKAVSKSLKRTPEGPSSDVKPKKKNINEIDRLLQDEGVVNLLYDVEQPDRKRLVPITKSRAKVMDLQKVQRELKIRKKLVRNAVLRLRTSTTADVTKVSPRSKRMMIHDVQDKKVEQVSSPKTSASPTEFILPAKIRNAADASIIVRRHSSSSFSSASGSPRVSVDAPEKSTEAVKSEDGTVHSLRSAKKRRDSQDEKINNTKKKKKIIQKSDTDVTVTNTSTISTTTTTVASNTIVNNTEEKVNVVRPGKKSEIKKMDKIGKQQENIPAVEDNVSSKVTTRSSNGAVPGKVTAKSKKLMRSKVTFARANELDNAEDSLKNEDELSACLAEAATALSVVNARNGATTRKSKGKVNTNMKTLDIDSNKMKTEMQSQFSNKEINVRRHGNLVQLILTPSSSTKIRNALSLQVMQEFKEALSILKRDDECRVVLLTSTGTSFCEGLDLSTLLHSNKDERRSVAQELAHAVKDFIKSLATFNKPIVAGVQGAAIGLGVTMLPLFDLVIASDKATFCTPYGKLGQIAEGAAVFTLSHILGSAITSELLLGGRTLTASEALRAGLVTRVLWPDRFQVELLPSLRAMSDQSSQSMEATKALLRHSLRKKLDAALESETYLLIQHWCSIECQTAIKAYIDGKIE
ncbi:CDYL2 protein, partial [Acromyrmex insinuator]